MINREPDPGSELLGIMAWSAAAALLLMVIIGIWNGMRTAQISQALVSASVPSPIARATRRINAAELARPHANSLTPRVNYSAGVLVIANLDDRDWREVSMKLNESYVLRRHAIGRHASLFVSAGQFTKEDGTGFDPGSTKPVSLSIATGTPNDGYWYGNWE